MNVLVLGAGLVGAPMAIDLAKDSTFSVTVADRSSGALSKFAGVPAISTVQKDLADPAAVRALVAEFDLVVSAVPGFMGFQALQNVIASGKNVVDIAFFPEDPFTLDDLAKERNVTAIVDCGVAPGMSNILTGYVDALLDQTERVLILVGGLPEVREWPYEYKAPFSPIDVIEEYTRPARYVENGQPVVRPALSDPELIDFPGIGTLEVFNTDGLRTLARTIDAPDMKEKTMRYPGHIERMRMLRESGFFSPDEIDVRGVKIRPIDLTTKLLFPIWKYAPGERDLTVMRVIVEGVKAGKRLRYTYDMVDRYDPDTETLSMARTTGYTATMAVRMVAGGKYTRTGISAPEYIGRDPGCVAFLLQGLRERGIVYNEKIEELS